jgi:hypothetical protein
MVGRLEQHGHSPLHCHMQCGADGLSGGEINPDTFSSIPHASGFHRIREKRENLSPVSAWQLALRFFRATAAEVGDLI